MKKLLLGSFLIVIALFVNCTSGGDDVSVFGDIYGTITDSKSGEPVRNAEVILSPGNKSTVSGSNGHFEFKTLEAGQYKVGVEADGYEYNSRQITVVPGQNTVCDFRLVEIFVEQVLKVTPTTLNFGTSQNEMSVTITNEGTEETEWSVNLGNNNWLSANPKTGRIAAGKSQTIVFAVNRDLVAEDKSAVVNIAAFGNTYPISVSCTPKKTKGELAVEPTSLSFDEELSELDIKIKNTGDGELNWTISGITADCLSVSDASGKIVAGGNKVVKVKLDRDKLEKDLTTTFTVSDGDKDISVAVTAKKKILKGELVVEPTSLNFGEDLSEQTITIKNVGDASLKWTISKVTSPLSVSEKEGELAAGSSKVVKVLLNRDNMSEDINTSFVVSDGDDVYYYPITVLATKGSAASSVAVPQGLYTYYMFEDNFEDSTENEIHGYGNNSPTFVTGVTSDSKAVKLSRTKNSSFIVPEGLFDTRDKTISFWGKDFDDGVIFYVVSENKNNAMFSLSMSNGVLKFVGRRYMNSYQYNNAPSFSHPTINDGKWHHIVLTSDFNKTSYALTTTTLYVDGMKVDTITEDGNPFTEAERENASYDTGVKFVMGGSLTLYSGTTLNGTNMSIDNLRIYDTRRLSADEVKAIYKSKE